MENNKRIVLKTEQTSMKELTLFGYAVDNKAELPTLNHFHESKIEVVILLKGMQQFSVNEHSFTLYENEAFIVYPNENHFCGESFKQDNEMLWFQIDISAANKKADPYTFEIIENFFRLDRLDAEELLAKIVSLKARKFALGRKLALQFKESFGLICNKDFDKRIAGRSLFLYSFINLMSKKAETKLLSPEIDIAKKYILDHITETIDINELNHKSGISNSNFKQKFKEEIGFYPKDFIKGMKIVSAKKDIISTNKSIEDIAFEYNFATKHFFVKAFSEVTGTTPKKYRLTAKKARRK